MLQVDYEEYRHDYDRRFHTECFYGKQGFMDWFFNLCKGNYKEDIYIPDPDSPWHLHDDGPSELNVKCWRTDRCRYEVRQIKNNGQIIYSDGMFTNGVKYWSDGTKQMCRDMIARQENPQFNFG